MMTRGHTLELPILCVARKHDGWGVVATQKHPVLCVARKRDDGGVATHAE